MRVDVSVQSHVDVIEENTTSLISQTAVRRQRELQQHSGIRIQMQSRVHGTALDTTRIPMWLSTAPEVRSMMTYQVTVPGPSSAPARQSMSKLQWYEQLGAERRVLAY